MDYNNLTGSHANIILGLQFNTQNLGFWQRKASPSTEGISGLLFPAAIWHRVYWDLELFRDERIGKPSLDLQVCLVKLSQNCPKVNSLLTSKIQERKKMKMKNI